MAFLTDKSERSVHIRAHFLQDTCLIYRLSQAVLDKIVAMLQLNLEEKKKIEEAFALRSASSTPILSARGASVRGDSSSSSPARISSNGNLWGVLPAHMPLSRQPYTNLSLDVPLTSQQRKFLR